MIGRQGLVTSTILYAALILCPILLFVFFYQESRIDQATMRNFRSLGTAAERINETLENFREVSKNHSFSLDSALLDNIISSCTSHEDSPKAGEVLKDFINKQKKTQISLGLSSEALFIGNTFTNADTKDHPNGSATRRSNDDEYETAHDDTNREQCALTLAHLRKAHPGECGPGDQRLYFEGDKLVIRDCRTLRQRDDRAYDALKSDSGLMRWMQRFGIAVYREIDRAFDQPTAHLSMFFDNYYVADEEGTVIFARQSKPQSYEEHRRHREGVSFAGLAALKDLLVTEDSSPLATLRSNQEPNESISSPAHTGHSAVRNIQVGDVDLSVFIHPFFTNSINVAENNEAPRGSTFYVIGVVLRSSLADEAIRIRLGHAVDATLAIAILLTLLPILRFWTAGDRSILRRRSLYSVCGSVLAASALSAVLLSGVSTKFLEGKALDRRLEEISDEITGNFRKERDAATAGLTRDLNEMERCAYFNAFLSEVPSRDVKKRILCPDCQAEHHPSPLWSLVVFPVGVMSGTLPTYAGAPKLHWQPRESPNPVPHWWPTSSFILNDEGRRPICKRYRKDNQALRLDLSFRKYFTEASREFRLYRIDSVTRGINQIVGSIKSPNVVNKVQHVAVAIQKFWSIDNLVLPPYFQYAILDEDGHTIFHSDKDRNSVSNFINDTDNDVAVQAALAYRRGAIVDVNYDGMPIRAHLRKLPSDEDWALVVFRSHALVDKISSLVSSLSIIAWTITTLVTFAVFGLLAAVRRARGKRPLSEAILSSTDARVGACCAILGIGGLTLSYQLSGSLSIVVGLLSPVIAGVVVICSSRFLLKRTGSKTRTRRCSEITTSSGPVWVRVGSLSCLVLLFSIVPMLTWQSYFQAQVSAGLVTHLKETAESQIYGKVNAVSAHANKLTYVGADDLGSCRGNGGQLRKLLQDGIVGFGRDGEIGRGVVGPCADEVRGDSDGDDGHRWLFDSLAPILAYSPLTWQMIWYRSKGETIDDVRIVSHAFDKLFGHARGTSDVTISWWSEVLCWLVIFSGVGLVLFLCYSAVRVKFGYERHVVRLSSFPGSESMLPKRLVLIKRSDREVQELMVRLSDKYTVKRLGWEQLRIVWGELTPPKCEDQRLREQATVFFVEDFRSATKGARSHQLALELIAIKDEDKVLICSDVVPLYHMDPGTAGDPHGGQPVWADEWRELMEKFHVRVLCLEVEEERRMRRRQARAKVPVRMRAGNLGELLDRESRANVDFQDVVREIEGELGSDGALSGLRRRERISQRIRGVAQARFKTLWAVSSFDERAQLYALAHGGSLNRERPAAISSLVNRGLITSTDPMELCSEAFGQFIKDDVDDSLDEWRRKGHGNWWRVTWLPLVLLAGLGLLFFINSNPDAIGVIAAIGAAFIGLVPVVASLLRVGQVVQPTVSSNDE